MLTPLAIDPGHPFPHQLNKSLNLAVMLRTGPAHEEQLFAVVQAPAVLARFVLLPLPVEPGGPVKHVFYGPLETVIRMHLPNARPLARCWDDAAFRVTRNSDIEIDDDEVEDLLKTIEQEVRKRRRGAAVRLEIEDDAPAEIEQFLTTALDLDASDVIRIPGLLDLNGLFQIHGLPGYPHLRDKQFVPQPVPEFAQAPDPFTAIRGRDILVHHPYESFSCVVDFVNAAADDERVLAVKQTLYRTSSDSPIMREALAAAPPTTASLRGRHRDQGPTRRGAQHRLGARAGKGRRPRRLRLRRPQDALQGGARRPQGGRRHPPLRPHVATGNATTRRQRGIYSDLGYLHLQPRLLRRRLRALQLPDRFFRAAAMA